MYVVLQLYTDLKELKSSEYYHRSKMQEYLSIAGNWVYNYLKVTGVQWIHISATRQRF